MFVYLWGVWVERKTASSFSNDCWQILTVGFFSLKARNTSVCVFSSTNTACDTNCFGPVLILFMSLLLPVSLDAQGELQKSYTSFFLFIT